MNKRQKVEHKIYRANVKFGWHLAWMKKYRTDWGATERIKLIAVLEGLGAPVWNGAKFNV